MVSFLAFTNFVNLGMWKNGQADLESALLDKVASCWKQHRSLKKKWSSMYHNRRDHEIVLLNALDQRWREDDGMATFPSLDSSLEQFEANGVRLENLDAGELLLQRTTSAEIGENFGRYTTMVYFTQENRTLEGIHADRQSSCGSNHVDTMVLDLDTELLHNEWHSAPSNPVQLLNRVNTRRQYFSGGQRASIPVVREVIGLILRFSHVDEGVSLDVRKAFNQKSLDESDFMDVFRNPWTAASGVIAAPHLNCTRILGQTDEIEGSNTPGTLEVNACIDETRGRMRSCSFDASTCEFPCTFGFELDENGCPKRECLCALEGIFEGDIKFSIEDIPLLVENYEEPSQDKDHAASKDLPRWDKNRVKNRVKIAYKFDSKLRSSKAKLAIKEAIRRYKQDTCIDFVPRTNERDFLIFTSQGGCWSYVGRRGGPQYISIGHGCGWAGVVQHELLHALGFWHEQSRPDRDSHIEIKPENIKSTMLHNFKKREAVDSLGSHYDKKSVMHYGGYAFSDNNQPTIVDKTTGQPIQSQRQDLSEEDIFQLNKMYNCENIEEEKPEWTQWSQWSTCSKTCGDGERERSRTCKKESSKVLAKQCNGSDVESKNCNEKNCPKQITENWSSWQTWTVCSATCNGGYQWRRRQCRQIPCVGPVWAARKCNTKSCENGIFGENQSIVINICPGGKLFHGDFNGDDKTDILCTHSDGWTEIFTSKDKDLYGDKIWEGKTTTCGKSGELHAGYFNSDRSNDVLCVNRFDGAVTITFFKSRKLNYKPDWSGKFKSFCRNENEDIIVLDANGDGLSDLACKTKFGSLSVLINSNA